MAVTRTISERDIKLREEILPLTIRTENMIHSQNRGAEENSIDVAQVTGYQVPDVSQIQSSPIPSSS